MPQRSFREGGDASCSSSLAQGKQKMTATSPTERHRRGGGGVEVGWGWGGGVAKGEQANIENGRANAQRANTSPNDNTFLLRQHWL